MVSFFTSLTTCVVLITSLASAIPLEVEAPSLARRANGLTGKFLHISDIHIDPKYTKGADVDNLCHVYKKKNKREKAGKFGTLGSECDSPIALVDATFNYLKKHIQDIDFIVYTGDTVRHDRDDRMPLKDSEIKEGHKAVLKYFAKTYNVNTIPVIPTIGNNDPFEHNELKAKDSLYKELKSIWSPLRLNTDANFLKGGYFVQNVVKDKLSIVNMNTMLFYKKNDAVGDCSGSSPGAVHLTWLEKTLKSYASKKTHKLYLMSHVPPTDEDGVKHFKSKCYTKYLNIIGKYGSTIAGHFTGHTNRDTLTAVYKKGSSYKLANPDYSSAKSADVKKAALGLFNGPSILPKRNPGFRVYTYETTGKNYPVGTILDWKQYYLDLKAANKKGKAEFKVGYTASSLYKVKHFDGPGVGIAVNNVAKNRNSVKKYEKYMEVFS